jgi:hypothetical protein
MHPHDTDTEGLSRSELIERAEALGVDRASLLTRAELTDEIVRRTVVDPIERRIARGLLGIARDLVARVVERGLHLPDAAAKIRGSERPSWMPPKPPIATVTLAEIYAKQGHRDRALSVLDEVLETEADHAAARALRDEIAASPAEAPPHGAPDQDVEPAESEPDRSEPDIEPPSPPLDAGSATTDLPNDAPHHDDTPPVGTIGVVEDAPLPARYDVDELVLMAVDPKTVLVCWGVRQRSADEARKNAAEGRLILRVVAVTASWEGPLVETRDIDVDKLVGDWFVRDLPAGAVLRAAIGWTARTRFEPLSVAMDVTASPAAQAPVGAENSSRFTAEASVASATAGVGDDLAAAAERARRRIAGHPASHGSGTSSWPAMTTSPPST